MNNIQIDTTLLEIIPPIPEIDMDVFVGDEYQHSAQTSASVGGITLSALPTIRRLVVATGVAIGTIPVPLTAIDPVSLQNVRLVFPATPDYVDDEYSRIREDMVASGIPMLSDEELRREIRERKGGDLET